MKKPKIRTFKEHLHEELKDPEFRRYYEEERQALELAIKITRLREKMGLSQQDLARLMNTSQQAISRLESGEYEGFTLKTLKRIAEVTGTMLKIEFKPMRSAAKRLKAVNE
jgi:DNA-binding transcriptional regulator YiaG